MKLFFNIQYKTAFNFYSTWTYARMIKRVRKLYLHPRPASRARRSPAWPAPRWKETWADRGPWWCPHPRTSCTGPTACCTSCTKGRRVVLYDKHIGIFPSLLDGMIVYFFKILVIYRYRISSWAILRITDPDCTASQGKVRNLIPVCSVKSPAPA